MAAPTPTLITDKLIGNVETELYIRVGGNVTMISTYLVKNFNAATWNINGVITSVDLYALDGQLNAKVGAPASFGFTSFEDLQNAQAQTYVNAAKGTGDNARCTFILVLPNRSAWYGNAIFQGLSHDLAVRSNFSTPYQLVVDGDPLFEQDVDAA
jgi:hypothetical protein